MADTYWLSFRLSDSGQWAASYDRRRQALVDEIQAASAGQKWWYETSSFFLFGSEEGISTIVTRVKEAIDVRADLVVLGKTDYKAGRIIGKSDDSDIFELVPFMKKV